MTVYHPYSQPHRHHPSGPATIVICRVHLAKDHRLDTDLGGGVVALDARTGDTSWTADIGTAEAEYYDPSMNGPPLVHEGIAYLGTTAGALCALETATGAERWRHEANTPVFGRPYYHDGTIYAGGGDGAIAVSAATGDELWHWRGIGIAWFGLPTKDVAYAAQVERGIVALDLATGNEVWSHECDPVRQAPCSDGKRAYFGTHDNKLLVLDLATREVSELLVEDLSNMADDAYGGAVATPPVVGGALLYVTTDLEILFACDVDTPGTVKWFREESAFPVSAVAGKLYLPTGDGIVVVDAATGEEITTVDIATETPPVIAGDHLFASGSNFVACIDLGSGDEVWRRDLDPDLVHQLALG